MPDAPRPPPLLPQNDSIEGIYDTLKECAAISKSAGGIGLSIHNIRATVRPQRHPHFQLAFSSPPHLPGRRTRNAGGEEGAYIHALRLLP